MDLGLFRQRIQNYRQQIGLKQSTLAHELGLHHTVLSHKLNGNGAFKLNNLEIKQIIRLLVSEGALTRHSEISELLDLLGLTTDLFSREEWRSAPLNDLTPELRLTPAVEKNGNGHAIHNGSSNGQEKKPPFWQNLPVQLTSLVGRKREIAEIARLLAAPATRLVTLYGSGGIGKTRLSVEAAFHLQNSFADGVCLVELAAITDPALIPQLILQTLGLSNKKGSDLETTLKDFLKERQFLLILDNCEQLVAGCAQFLTPLIQACPALRVIATSRETLGVPGEVTYRVPSLDFPAAGEHDLEKLQASEAVQLFLDRAKNSRPDFSLDATNFEAIGEICRRLDGIPMALELAAARVRVLNVEQIRERLEDRFNLLTGSANRLALPRHQTLRALIDWSYDLLPASQQTLLARLAIFTGKWTLQAVESICADPPLKKTHILELLDELVNKSLIVPVENSLASDAAYRMLETMREYALEKLTADVGKTGWEDLARKHLAYYSRLAEKGAGELRTKNQARVLSGLDQEEDNLRAALEFALDNRLAEDSLQLAGALGDYWYIKSYFKLGRDYLERAENLSGGQTDNPIGFARVLRWAGKLAGEQGDYKIAAVKLETALNLYQSNGDERELAAARVDLAIVTLRQGNYQKARELLEESLPLLRRTGNSYGLAVALNQLGVIACNQAHYKEAATLLKESLVLRQELNDKHGTASTLTNLGMLAHLQGDYTTAESFYISSLKLRQQINDRQGIAGCLNNLGILARIQNKYENARRNFEQSYQLALDLDDKQIKASSLHNLGVVEQNLGEYKEAANYLKKSLDLSREMNDNYRTVSTLYNLGFIAYLQENLADAAQNYRESLELAQRLNDRRGATFCCQGLGKVARQQGDAVSARQYLGEGLKICLEIDDKERLLATLLTLATLEVFSTGVEASSTPNEASCLSRAATMLGVIRSLNLEPEKILERAEYAEYETVLATTKANLPENDFAKAFGQGQQMTSAQILEFCGLQ